MSSVKKLSRLKEKAVRVLAVAAALCLLLSVTAAAEIELVYEGTVTAGETIPVPALYGGRVEEILSVRETR